MTIAEMHTKIDEVLDKSNSPWFNAIEKDNFLNEAQIEFVDTRYAQFEFNEKRREELNTLVRKQTYTDTNIINLDSITDLAYVISLGAKLTVCGISQKSKVSPEQHDDEFENDRDPFNKASDDNLKYIQYNDNTNDVLEIKSDTTPDELYLTYLKYPVKVSLAGNIDCELNEVAHKQIVDIAIRMMMMPSEDTNYQVQINEINNQE
jgi:hypothetical protein